MYSFTVEDVAKTIRSIAVSQPDFIYSNQPERPSIITDCSYLTAGVGVEGGKACIVGQALTSLGVSDEDLVRVERTHASQAISDILGIHFFSKKDSRILDWIDNVQERQDIGESWSNAVELADDES